MINDECDLNKFQHDFPEFVFQNYKVIKEECYEVARLLDDDWQNYYDIVEWYDDKDKFIELITEGYKKTVRNLS